MLTDASCVLAADIRLNDGVRWACSLSSIDGRAGRLCAPGMLDVVRSHSENGEKGPQSCPDAGACCQPPGTAISSPREQSRRGAAGCRWRGLSATRHATANTQGSEWYDEVLKSIRAFSPPSTTIRTPAPMQ